MIKEGSVKNIGALRFAEVEPEVIRLEWCQRCRLVRIPEDAT